MDKKQDNKFDTNTRECVTAIAKGLTVVFKNFSRQTREKAWKRITSEEGLKEIQKILQDPNRPLNGFQKLRESFQDYLDRLDD